MYVQNYIPLKLLGFAYTNIESFWIVLVSLPRQLLLVFFIDTQNVPQNVFTFFYDLMDSVWLLVKEILLLGDFNIDLLNFNHSNWQRISRNYNLYQCITLPTRITHSSRTLIDQIYSSNPSSLVEMCIPCIDVSDHYVTCVTWSKKNFKIPRRQHTSITFWSFKKNSTLPLSCQI